MLFCFQIVLRGTVVFTAFKNPSSKVTQSMTNALMEEVSPGARIIAFYVDERTNELVADAVKFSVNPICQGQKVGVCVICKRS